MERFTDALITPNANLPKNKPLPPTEPQSVGYFILNQHRDYAAIPRQKLCAFHTDG